ncbi:hypothetical protein JZX87_14025 [Agrobacterium sp. Ap1]|uniref:hypothetical protein n=1 Tax=Agrobacterium sp. Ap1 TaxID=2815337 RepID=UPI001A90434F|nr:hypothetical protein [Agrobacterium sp. Ap1]MBO0142280.1 hypothetical protein [Agrobacterium sp. Ap1]
MSEPIRLVIVTDDANRAAPAIFGMALSLLPAWVLVMTDWQEIAALEEGAPCMALWFQKGGFVSLAETTWRERRQDVRLDDDFGHHFNRVTAWLDKRDEADRQALKRALEDVADQEGVVSFDELVRVQAAKKAAETSLVKHFPKPSKWI